MRGGWRLGRIAGVEVRAEPSLLLLGILITYNLWIFFSNTATLEFFSFRINSVSPPLSSGAALGLAVATTALFLASILAHELAHAAAFRARRIPVRGITLFMFGGFTSGTREAERPADEFLVAAVGPALTGALGLLFLALHVATSAAGLHALRAMFGYLALLNLFMAAFNLLPGLPLDGGRVLLAVLWRLTGKRSRATRLAARAGQVVAGLIAATGIADVAATGDFGGVWPLLIGWMLYSSSTAALSQADRREALEATTAGQVMSPPPPTVPADLPVHTAVDRFLAGRHGEAFPVVEDGGRVVGFVSLRMANGVPPDRPVRDAMIGTDAVATARPDERMTDVAERIQDRQAQTVLVMDGHTLVGVIEPEDLARLFRSQGRGRWSRSGQPRPTLPPAAYRIPGPASPPTRPDQEGGRS